MTIIANRYFWLLLLITSLTMASLALNSRLASGHAAFESSQPPPNSVLDAVPTQVTIHFTEPLEPSQTGAELLDSSGSAVEGATSAVDTADSFALILTVPPILSPGTYVVSWRNVSTADGHPMEGFFSFSIQTAGDASGAVAALDGETGGPPYWWVSVVKWVAYLGLALVVAGWPLWLLVLQPAFGADDSGYGDLQSGVWRLLTAGVLTFEVGSIAALYNQAWAADPDARIANRIRDVLTETRYGEIWFYRLVALAAFVVLSIVAVHRGSKLLRIAAALAALAIPLWLSLIAHASAHTVGRGAAITNSWLHFGASMVWTGGLVYLVLATHLTRRMNREAMVELVPRFSVIAIACWIIMALTGTYTSWLVVGSVEAATGTDYGKTLIAKLTLLAAALAFAAVNFLVLTPQLKRNESNSTKRFSASVIAECLLAVAALLTVGRLVGLQPARDAHAQAQPAGIVQTVSASDHELRLTISPGAPGPNVYTIAGDDIPADPEVEALIRLTRPGATEAERELKLARQPDGSFSGSGSELSLTGEWKLELIIRKIGSFQWEAETIAPIPATGAGHDATHGWRFDTVGLIGMLGVAVGVVLGAGAFLVDRTRRIAVSAAAAAALVIGVAGMAAGKI